MKESGVGREIYLVSHLITIITMTVFSAVLIVLNIILGWEKWTIPVAAAGLGLCLFLHISGRGTPKMRIYSYGVFLIIEAFYYTVNIDTLYDSAGLIVMMAFIFAMTGERLLVAAGSAAGICGMVLHILRIGAEGGLKFRPSNIVRSAWQFVLVILGAVLADRMSAAWFNIEKHYQRRIDSIIEENERANNFLANVSHEIRTPVNAVMGLAAILEKEDISPGIRGNIEAIAEAGHRVADQIGDIMDYTEIDMKKLMVTNERYMISSVVNDLISQLRFTEDYGLELVIDLSPNVPAELIGDESKIKKILRQLISNGFKFTRTGGVRVRISAKKRDYGVNLELEVTDTGVGMSEQEIEHIYEKFYQADSGRSRTAGGLGLGIPIVNGLARAMGGFIHIESTPGRGSVVRVTIPQSVTDAAPCISVADRESIFAVGFLSFEGTNDPRIKDFYMEMVSDLAAGLGVNFRRVKSREELERLEDERKITHLFVGSGVYRNNKGYIDGLADRMNVILVADKDHTDGISPRIYVIRKPFSGSQITNYLQLAYFGESDADRERMSCPGVSVLVVDDEPMNLLVARGIFGTYGMNVSTAASGAEAIELCGSEDYDIIFMDHMMPGMDGVEAMKRLRTNAGRQNIELCIVALTANATSSSKEMFLSEGFDAFLPKPIDLTELERVLKHVLPRSAIVYERTSKAAEEEKPAQTGKPVTAPVPEPEPAPAVNTASDDIFAALGSAGVNVSEGMGYCQDDEGFYREILAEYSRDREAKLAELEGFFAREDWKDYAIRVHSVKSTSKTIGADDISEQARLLESAAKSGDADYIRGNHAGFIGSYGGLTAAVARYLAASEGTDGGDDDPDDHEDTDTSSDADDEIFEFTPGDGEDT